MLIQNNGVKCPDCGKKMKIGNRRFGDIICGCKTLLLALLIFLIPFTSHAGFFDEKHELIIGYAPYCYHWKRDREYNENDNHAILIAVDNWFGLTFRNSYYDRTFAAGYVFRTKKWKPFDSEFYMRGNLLVGLVHGYGDRFTLNFNGVAPAAAPTGEIGYKKLAGHVMVLPAVATFMVSYSWDIFGK